MTQVRIIIHLDLLPNSIQISITHKAYAKINTAIISQSEAEFRHKPSAANRSQYFVCKTAKYVVKFLKLSFNTKKFLFVVSQSSQLTFAGAYRYQRRGGYDPVL
nr:hypothetical transcript [Hymenolepis microstoma]